MALKIELVALTTILLGKPGAQVTVAPGEKFTLDDGKEAKWLVEAGAALLLGEAEAQAKVKAKAPKGELMQPATMARPSSAMARSHRARSWSARSTMAPSGSTSM